jgi:hypothetical protein
MLTWKRDCVANPSGDENFAEIMKLSNFSLDFHNHVGIMEGTTKQVADVKECTETVEHL